MRRKTRKSTMAPIATVCNSTKMKKADIAKNEETESAPPPPPPPPQSHTTSQPITIPMTALQSATSKFIFCYTISFFFFPKIDYGKQFVIDVISFSQKLMKNKLRHATLIAFLIKSRRIHNSWLNSRFFCTCSCFSMNLLFGSRH